ncbi:MAG: RnfABCDGE type electron transport complex subunit B [Oscillospiraceae bacterium]
MFETYILPVLIFAALGAFAGILLTVVSKAFAVKTDERLESIAEALPQINCGACGYSGCNDYAAAVLNGAPTNLCKPGGEAASKKISEIMGVGFADVDEEVAFVRCGGGCNETSHKYIYDGTQSCAASNRYYSGSKTCTSGCLGFGDCVRVCPNGAIDIIDGIAVINPWLCVGCGLCAKTCPNQLIVMKPKTQKIDVVCMSTAIGKVTKSICKTGCIGCKLCERKCPQGAIKVENNFATIDYSKCTQCGICAEVCPTGAIKKSC